MKKPFFSPPQGLLLHALTTLLTGVGCALPLSMVLGLTAPIRLIVLCCAGITLLFALLDCLPRLHMLAYPLLCGALIALAVSHASQTVAIGNALTLFLNGQPLALAAYSRPIALLLSLLFTGIGASLSRSGDAFFPLTFLTIAALFVVTFLGVDVPPLALLPLVISLLLNSRAPAVSARRILPCAAIVLAVALLTLPLAGRTVPALADFAAKARQAIGDYLFFTEARTTFSLSSAGWQPLGTERLGGSVSPTDEPVMQVYTSGRTLLRGTVKNAYTGFAWSDTTDQRRYLFIDPRFSALRRDLFDLERPERTLRDRILALEPITVFMRADAASTLYLTQRFTSPTGEDVVAYFSPSTEVFATRSLTEGMSYTFTGSRLSGASEGVRDAVLSAYDETDNYLPSVRALYGNLPDSVEAAVYDLAQQITADADNDFDRACAICLYLQQHFTYTLHQSDPPLDRDFVSWFLTTEQQGYCTSFASAMAVLGRAIGLPTRYIEGYAAEPDADGIARVTQQNAHAWAEVYFAGFGWLAFDATPGTGFTPDGSEPDDSDPPADLPTPSPSLSPTPSPTPSPEPEITPTPEPDDDTPENTPTPEPTPTVTPSPEPSPTPTPSVTPPPEDEPPNPPPTWLFLLLFLLLLAALIALRLWLSAPARVAGLQRRSNDALLIWYRACAEALLCMGIPSLPGEAPATYLARAQEQLTLKPPLTILGKALCISRYSAHNLARVQVRRAERTYNALLGRLHLHQRLRLYLRRVLHGTHL